MPVAWADVDYIDLCSSFLFQKIGFSRAKELEYIRLLNKQGVGVPLVAWFSNGIVSKLVPGRDLNNEELIDILTDEAFARFEQQRLS